MASVKKLPDNLTELEKVGMRPLLQTSRWFALALVGLAGVVVWWMYAYSVQLRGGLAVTGMRDVVMWGLYIVNFVFFIGISHAGTLISAILRVTGAGWRTPITRMAEVITVVALMIGALMPITDLGHPERALNLVIFGRYQSPILWDFLSITTYLTGSLIYLYLPMIPDMAMLRDKLPLTAPAWRRQLYTMLAAGWRGTPTQKRRLERAISIMAVLIIPIAVSVHTVVSWIFSMTVRPGWNSTIFGPYFVVGAIFSGIASILIAMVIFRRIYRLEAYITKKHFVYLGYLMLALGVIYMYFTAAEYLTVAYKLADNDRQLLTLLFTGSQAPWFWAFGVGGTLVPVLIVAYPRTRTIPGILVAAILVNIGMWLKRFVIVVPSLQVPLMPFDFGRYQPTWVEWSVTAGAFAGFILIFALFSKVFPIISVWEVAEQEEKAARTASRLVPAPGPAAPREGSDV
ncbi:MAG: polysulfide reductase NrfD [Chloroflexi bacterium]|nr:polysulfide reductase NrfD [Chloroflexota bacterium]